jgi:hypothetical protein
MFLITYSEHNFDGSPVLNYTNEVIELQMPKSDVYMFDLLVQDFNNISEFTSYLTPIKSRGRNKLPIPDSNKTWLIDNLGNFSREQLLQIYVDRLFFGRFHWIWL